MSARPTPTHPSGKGCPCTATRFRQLVSASTWRATWYLLAYLVVGWVLFGVVLTAGIATLTLMITLAGLPLLIVTAAVIRGCANAERLRLRPIAGEQLTGGYRDTTVRGMLVKIRAAWTDAATWRSLAYLGGLFPFLWALDLAAIIIWLTFAGCATLPAWYWAVSVRRTRAGRTTACSSAIFPNGPDRHGAVGIFVDTPAKAIGVALVFVVLSLLFQYVVVLTARLHGWVAYSLLRSPEDPLAAAKGVLGRPGPLGPLGPTRRNGNSGRTAPAA